MLYTSLMVKNYNVLDPTPICKRKLKQDFSQEQFVLNLIL